MRNLAFIAFDRGDLKETKRLLNKVCLLKERLAIAKVRLNALPALVISNMTRPPRRGRTTAQGKSAY